MGCKAQGNGKLSLGDSVVVVVVADITAVAGFGSSCLNDKSSKTKKPLPPLPCHASTRIYKWIKYVVNVSNLGLRLKFWIFSRVKEGYRYRGVALFWYYTYYIVIRMLLSMHGNFQNPPKLRSLRTK